MLIGSVVFVRRLCVGRSGGWLRDRYPAVYKIQRTVLDGGKSCLADLKTYYRVSSAMKRGQPLDQFSRHQLEVYVLTPGDIQKLVAIAVVIALPMTIFILAIALAFFPRLLLTRHFWTLEQTEKFRSAILQKRRQHHYAKIAQYLVDEAARRAEKGDIKAAALSQAVAGSPMTLVQLTNHLDAFRTVDVNDISPRYQLHLSRAHGLWSWGSSDSSKLCRRASILATLDRKLREEGVENLPMSDVKQSLYIRQFDIVHISDEEERRLLKDWLKLTQRDSSDGVVLHAPVLSQLHLSTRPS